MEFPFRIGSVKVKQNKGTQRYHAPTVSRRNGRKNFWRGRETVVVKSILIKKVLFISGPKIGGANGLPGPRFRRPCMLLCKGKN